MLGKFCKKGIATLLILTLVFLTACGSNGAQDNGREARELERLIDQEFKQGSGIKINVLTDVQTQNLYCLAKVWGYVKYRHPMITSGKVNWDAELFRVMPKVLKAKNHAEAQTAIQAWLNHFPLQKPTDKRKDENIAATPKAKKAAWKTDSSWISNTSFLGQGVSSYLTGLSKLQMKDYEQGYVGLAEGDTLDVSMDCAFSESMEYDDAGVRLLSLFRYWNIITYFYPYQNLMEDDWDQVLVEKIPELALGKDQLSYTLSMANLTTYLHDSHAFFWDKWKVYNHYFGSYIPLFRVENLDGKIVVIENTQESIIKLGDEILAINGVPIEKKLKECRKYVSLSNDEKFSQSFEPYLLNSDKKNTVYQVLRDGKELDVEVECIYDEFNSRHLKPLCKQESGFLENGKVGFLNMEELEIEDVDRWMKKFSDCEGIVVDFRYGGPAYFAVYTLAEYFVPEPMLFDKFYASSPTESGTFYKCFEQTSGNGFVKTWFADNEESFSDKMNLSKLLNNGMLNTLLGKGKERQFYDGKVVVLVGERTISKYETAVMSLQNGPNVSLVGETSPGCNGDIIKISLPGNLETYFSGYAITYPDGKQLQRVGIKPDVEVKMTTEGLVAGKDEPLEYASKMIVEKI
ncbi:MAG: S41 family peptidase [Clostridia bacterium]|nr:S41 family peptidase [Clostridia bacterium]